MSFSIYALDNEFAVSTGSNVNSGPGRSDFDYPPTSSNDLVITPNDGDPDPRQFEVGDTYDISYDGPGGAHTLEDAVVIRSDMAPGGGGVIVFEGLDENGELTQVIWTPDFNLEKWYFDNFNEGQPPQFYTSDQNASYTHSFICFAESTRIETALGGIPAGEIWEGDQVITLDAGSQPVQWIGRRKVRGHGRNAPVLFSPGMIGNHAPLRLSQQHRVLIRTPMAELLFGAPEVLVPAKALVNGDTIRFDPCKTVVYVHLLLPAHHLLMAEGALCESLLPGDMAAEYADLPSWALARRFEPARPVLSFAEAIALAGAAPAPAPKPAPEPRTPALACL